MIRHAKFCGRLHYQNLQKFNEPFTEGSTLFRNICFYPKGYRRLQKWRNMYEWSVSNAIQRKKLNILCPVNMRRVDGFVTKRGSLSLSFVFNIYHWPTYKIKIKSQHFKVTNDLRGQAIWAKQTVQFGRKEQLFHAFGKPMALKKIQHICLISGTIRHSFDWRGRMTLNLSNCHSNSQARKKQLFVVTLSFIFYFN